MPIKKMPPTEGRPGQERWRMTLVRLWVNGLRSNATPLELYKLDIRSTRNNLWVRWATLIEIPLVLFHCPHSEGPSLHRQEVLQLNWHGNSTLSQVKHEYARRWVDQVTPKDAQRSVLLLEWKFATLKEMCPERQYVLRWTFSRGVGYTINLTVFESKSIDIILGTDCLS
jgi:hypothetical protein